MLSRPRFFLFIGFVLLAFPFSLVAQGPPIVLPEFFGFYVLDSGKLIAVHDGKGTAPPALTPISVSLLRQSAPEVRNAIEVGPATRFIVFDPAVAEAVRGMSLYRLPLVQNEISVSDVSYLSGQERPTVRAVNLPGMVRIEGTSIRLLQKPVSGQTQMIELVPDSILEDGVYGLLYYPPSGAATAAGSSQGWSNILLVGGPQSQRSGPCINIVVTGGLGGMLGVGTRGPSGFPLLAPQQVQPCALAPQRSPEDSARPPSPASPAAVSTSSEDVPALVARLEKGERVDLAIRYKDSSPGRGVGARDGVITVSKDRVSFKPSLGSTPFSVEPAKILEVKPQSRIKLELRVAVPTDRPGKEDIRKYEIFHPSTFLKGMMFTPTCPDCDLSLGNVEYLLQYVKRLQSAK